jgi:hypothetical protein
MPIILATQKQRPGGSQFKASPGKKFAGPCLENPFTKISLAEWLKVKDLS